MPAFRLANMWNFTELRAYLLPLVDETLNDVDKVAFAQEFDFKDWLIPAYTRICQGGESLTSEDAAKIGIEGLLLIFRIREEPFKATTARPFCTIHNQFRQLYCTGCGYSSYPVHPEATYDLVKQKVENWFEGGRVFVNRVE